jgi:hypothetical protein
MIAKSSINVVVFAVDIVCYSAGYCDEAGAGGYGEEEVVGDSDLDDLLKGDVGFDFYYSLLDMKTMKMIILAYFVVIFYA